MTPQTDRSEPAINGSDFDYFPWDLKIVGRYFSLWLGLESVQIPLQRLERRSAEGKESEVQSNLSKWSLLSYLLSCISVPLVAETHVQVNLAWSLIGTLIGTLWDAGTRHRTSCKVRAHPPVTSLSCWQLLCLRHAGGVVFSGCPSFQPTSHFAHDEMIWFWYSRSLQPLIHPIQLWLLYYNILKLNCLGTSVSKLYSVDLWIRCL